MSSIVSAYAPRSLADAWPLLVRLGWLVVVVWLLGFELAAIPRHAAQIAGQAGTVAAWLAAVGLPLAVYVAAFMALQLAAVAAFIVTAGAVLWQRSREALVVVNALWFTVFPVQTSLAIMAATATDQAAALDLAPFLLGWSFLLVFFYLFPDGLFIPRWSLLPGLALLALDLGERLLPSAPLSRLTWPPGLALLVWTAFLALGLVSQWQRHHRVADPQDRRQSRSVIIGLAVIGLVSLAWAVPGCLAPALLQPGSLYVAGTGLLAAGSLLAIPVMVAVNVLRYRLFQIDVIVNRALVYVTLTAVLVLVYLLCVLLLQRGFQALTGQEHDLAIVVSTLASAVLFQPLRARLQAFIDRRFYRRKYDAAQTLAAFGTCLRDEVDVAALSRLLAGAVQETMQPAHLSLWLRTTERPDQVLEQEPELTLRRS